MEYIYNPTQDKIVEEGIKWFFNSGSPQVFEIDGEAGVGKSVTLWRIINGIGLPQYQILPMAYTGQAAIVMRTKGFSRAKSIHATLYHVVREEVIGKENPFESIDTSVNKKKYIHRFVPLEVGDIPSHVKLLVIDEGYMVPKKMRYDILKHGIKVLVAGDMGQLPPINDEPAFLTGEGIHHLTQIMRQEEGNPIIYLAHRARRGLPIHCGVYGNNVMVIEDKDLTFDMIMNVGNAICGTNKTRDIINNKVRTELHYDGMPRFGERVICKNNNWDKTIGDIALTNGLTGYIASPVSINSFKKKNVFEMNFKPDMINDCFIKLPVNYDYLISDYTNRASIKNNRFDNKHDSELFEYAYALTTHSAQGSEYNSGIFIEEFLRPDMQNQLIYTGITRFKHNLIYVKRTRRFM